MHLKEYIQSGQGNATRLAAAIGVAPTYLSQMASGERGVSAARARLIETATNGDVMRWDTRPKDWNLIWPELIGTPKAPKLNGVKKNRRSTDKPA